MTPAAEAVGKTCAELHALLLVLDGEGVAFQKWSLPIVVAVAAGSERFSDLRRTLPGITARALALTVKALGNAGLVDRHVSDDYPPAVNYRLTKGGRRVARLAARLN